MVAYSTSKGALSSFTIGLAKEVAREGIRVNAVAPGMIVTDMTVGFADQVAQTVPVGRCGEPEEIAAAVARLVSEEASYAVGSVMTVSGRPVAPPSFRTERSGDWKPVSSDRSGHVTAPAP